MKLFNLNIKSKSLALLCCLIVGYIGSIMCFLPFIHSFNVASFWSAMLIIVGIGTIIFVLMMLFVSLCYLWMNPFNKNVSFDKYFMGSIGLLGLFGCIVGGVVYILGFWPYIAMFIGLILTIIASGYYLVLHYRFLEVDFGRYAKLYFKRHRFIVFCVMVASWVIWLIF